MSGRTGPSALAWGVRVGAVLWLLRPTYLLTEAVAAAGTRGGYSFADDTVSDLGVLGCVSGSGGAPLCSPWHAVMNGSFVVFGLTLALGAVLLAPALGRGWHDARVRVLVVAWVVAGASSVATGLAPLDRDAGLHHAVALPVFVAQPVGLALLGLVLRSRRVVATVLLFAAVLSAVGAVGFGVVLPGDAAGRGAVERLALWPTFLVLPLVSWGVLAGLSRRPSARRRWPGGPRRRPGSPRPGG